jgi:hypothetical protein
MPTARSVHVRRVTRTRLAILARGAIPRRSHSFGLLATTASPTSNEAEGGLQPRAGTARLSVTMPDGSGKTSATGARLRAPSAAGAGQCCVRAPRASRRA